jgi:hypothetical protein
MPERPVPELSSPKIAEPPGQRPPPETPAPPPAARAPAEAPPAPAEIPKAATEPPKAQPEAPKAPAEPPKTPAEPPKTPAPGNIVALEVGTVGSAPPHAFRKTHILRGNPDARIVAEITKSMRANGWQGPRIPVVVHNGELYILDGHHRVAAARRARINVEYEVVGPAEMNHWGYKTIEDVVRAHTEAGPDRNVHPEKFE